MPSGPLLFFFFANDNMTRIELRLVLLLETNKKMWPVLCTCYGTLHARFSRRALQPVGAISIFCKSTRHKIRKYSLVVSFYKERNTFRQFAGLTNGLEFLPLHDIASGMDSLQTATHPDGNGNMSFITSFRACTSKVHFSWYWEGTEGTLGLTRCSPRFPPGDKHACSNSDRKQQNQEHQGCTE